MGLAALHDAFRARKGDDVERSATAICETRTQDATALVVRPGRPNPSWAANCITIRGSFVGTRQDMVECLAFAAEGKVKADIEIRPLSSINETFARLAHGDVPSRVVLELA
jgi:D-arabinose 1-dehydrogenase-like Zn-dependent alcohol dehydrogenase